MCGEEGMKPNCFLIVIVMVFVASLSAWGEDSPLQPFTSTAGGFSISMPGTPKETVQNVDSAAGPLKLHQFLVEDGNIAYIVMYNDYPRVPDNQDVFFNNVRDGGMNAVKGTLKKEKVISRQGYPGRAFDIETSDTLLLQDVYLVGKRLYQVILGVPKTDSMPSQTNQFFGSFKLAQP
jgi:hypothetical protein